VERAILSSQTEFSAVELRALAYYYRGELYRSKVCRQRLDATTHSNQLLAQDLAYVHFHISIWEALGRCVRRNYGWIFGILGVSYLGKLLVHPTPLHTLAELWQRATEGPVPGQMVIGAGVVFYGTLAGLALITLLRQKAVGRAHDYAGLLNHEDPITRLAM
jgi:uncharacterized membrane protein